MSVTTRRIPVAEPVFSRRELEYVTDCIQRKELTMSGGGYVQRFEESFAKYVGSRFAMATTSGTTALHLALETLIHGRKGAVVVPGLTYVATANTVRYCGAEVVLCDVDPISWNLDPNCLWKLLKQRSDIIGVVPVHLYGTPCDMQDILDAATLRGLFVVEDAAEALGASWRTYCKASAYSFYANKLITTGEGGMVVTNDEEVARRVRLLRGQGVDPNHRYYHSEIGFNYRMTALQAAVGLAQLERIDSAVCARNKVGDTYLRLLKHRFPVQGFVGDVQPVCWMFGVLVPPAVNRDNVMQRMADLGVETRPFFVPLHDLPMYRQKPLPTSADLGARGISLPTHEKLSEEDVEYVVRCFTTCVEAES